MRRLIAQQQLLHATRACFSPTSSASTVLRAASLSGLEAQQQSSSSSTLRPPANPWQQPYSTTTTATTSSSTQADASQQQQQQKRHTLKCSTTPAGTAVSQAIACMVDRDVMPRQQLCDKMEQLSQQLAQDVAAYSSTELSAFAEACRRMEFQHKQAFSAVMQQLAPAAADIAADELPSLLWAASTLASETPSAAKIASSSSSSSKVPQNDGVIGSVNSSRIADSPAVVDFMLGASQVLSGDMDSLDSQELPIIAAALERLEYRDPFLLTVLAETVLERKGELSEGELVELLQSFAAMGRWFFDNRVLDQLTAVLVERAKAGAAEQGSVDKLAACLDGINHRSKVLAAYLEEQLEP